MRRMTTTPIHTTPQPLDLPRLVMRRAGLVALAVWSLAVVLGLSRVGDDIEDEVSAAMTLGGMVARLGSLATVDDGAALASLNALQQARPLRHLQLQVRDEQGKPLLAAVAEPASGWAMSLLLSLHREWLSAPDARQVSWVLTRPGDVRWTVSLHASHESERREALRNFSAVLALLLLCTLGLLVAMHWNVRRALAPVGRLLEAMAGIEEHNVQKLRSLPMMPSRELEAVATGLRHLGDALALAETQRRLLSQQVLGLQEDERGRLARELHDEFGQRLTALRVDAAWLGRRLAADPALLPVVQGMARQCELVQHDIRQLLTRLQPFGASLTNALDTDTGESMQQLLQLLQALVASWAPPGREQGFQVQLKVHWLDAQGRPGHGPTSAQADALGLPRALALTLYRISQEALTNVARHAQARQAMVELHIAGDLAPGSAVSLDWQVSDDGQGLAGLAGGLPRGNGLAGMRERVWAQGAELQCDAAQPGEAAPGLRLSARFEFHWLVAPRGLS
jgi:two-component system sensor histidine kinase UhpB